MLTAKEACAIARSCVDTKLAKIRQNIESAIDMESKRGGRSYTYGDEIPEQLIHELKRLGYQVEAIQGFRETNTCITW